MSFEYIAADYDFPLGRAVKLGQGGYGVVCEARKRSTNSTVVIKRVSMRDANASQYDAYLTKSVAREILNQNACEGFPYVAKLLDWYRSKDGFDAYLVVEKWPYDMHKYLVQLRRDHGILGIPLDGVRVIMCQLLIALDFLHSRRILHRDLSLRNVFVDPSAGNVCLADFGLSKVVTEDRFGLHAVNMAAAPYKPPEVLCECTETPQTKWAAGVWSLGCIFMELVTGDPFMSCERDLKTQFKVLFETFRPDSDSFVAMIQQHKCHERWVRYLTHTK
jgi:serine/threonine protein kinase